MSREARASGSPILGLNRPQYAAIPEVLVSALAWSAASEGGASGKFEIDGREVDALAYGSEAPLPKNLSIGLAKPDERGERFEALVAVLASQLHLDPEKARHAAAVLVDDLQALRPPKAKSVAISPVNHVASLLQNASGLARVKRPPNYAAIIRRMYLLGGGSDYPEASMMAALGQEGGVPDWMRGSIDAISPEFVREAAGSAARWARHGTPNEDDQPAWLEGVPTPYSWFAGAWSSLTGEGWIDHMPRRRWIDWCACTLRTVLGMGYLYEMTLAYRAVSAIADDDRSADEAARHALSVASPLLAWDEGVRPSSRDIRARIRTAVVRGTACLEAARDWIEDEGMPDPSAYVERRDGLAKWIEDARRWRDATGRESLARELARRLEDGASSRSANNVDETIIYSLRARGDALATGDLYGLLSQRGPYTIVDPGQEWFVAVASLCAVKPGGLARVGDVEKALDAIGVRPGYAAIVRRLEMSGLGRSSHDADEAIELKAAF